MIVGLAGVLPAAVRDQEDDIRAPEFRVGVDVVVRVGLKRDDPEDTFRVGN